MGKNKGNFTIATKPYWSNTGSNDIIKELAGNADSDARADLETLISGGTIKKPAHENITYGDVYANDDNVWNFLFFTGYLKMKDIYIDSGGTTYLELAIPNKEVRQIYKETIKTWFDKRMKSIDNTDLIKALEQGDCEAARDFINNLFVDALSYFDSSESFYHGLLAGLLARTGKYRMDSNKESGYGRYDLVLKTTIVSTGRVIILEFKIADNAEQLEAKCDEALKQIEDKKYTGRGV